MRLGTLAPLLLTLALTVAASADAQTPAQKDALTQTQTDKGFLTVTSTPVAHVMIDGMDIGKMTPVTQFPLAPGRHKVTLYADDGNKSKRQFGIEITAGQEKKLAVTL
jgi:hypothetical protein